MRTQKIVTLNPDESEKVSFYFVPKRAKVYAVSVNGLTGQFRAISPVVEVYTLGIYYFYREGYEGSPDSYAWHENWDEYCRWLIGYHISLLTDFIKSLGQDTDMAIMFVQKYAVPEGFNLHSWDTAALARTLPGHYNVDFCIIVAEDNLHSVCMAFHGFHTVMVRDTTLENSIRGMEGISLTTAIGFELIHEIGHLFGLDHCSFTEDCPCPMSQCQIRNADWLAKGKRIWFCDRHRVQILGDWSVREHK